MNPDDKLIEGFARSWEQAMRGETFPIATLWDELDSDTEQTDTRSVDADLAAGRYVDCATVDELLDTSLTRHL